MGTERLRPPTGVLTGLRFAIGLGATVFVVTLLSAAIGFVGAEGHRRFDWLLATTTGTAVGTTVLAFVTAALAYTSSAEVSATRELASLTRSGQEQLDRADVVLHHIEYRHEPGDPNGDEYLSLSAWNAGRGAALRVEIHCTYRISPDIAKLGRWMWPVLPHGTYESFSLPIEWIGARPSEVSTADFEVAGTFIDRSSADVREVDPGWGYPGTHPG